MDVDAYLAGSTPKITFQNPKLTLEKFGMHIYHLFVTLSNRRKDLKVQGGAR